MKPTDFQAAEVRITSALKERANGGDNEAAAILLLHIRAMRKLELTLAWEKERDEYRHRVEELESELAELDEDGDY